MKQKGIAGCLELVFFMNNVKFLVNRTNNEINVKQNTVMCGFARGKWAFVDADTPVKEKDVPYTLEDSIYTHVQKTHMLSELGQVEHAKQWPRLC